MTRLAVETPGYTRIHGSHPDTFWDIREWRTGELEMTDTLAGCMEVLAILRAERESKFDTVKVTKMSEERAKRKAKVSA